VNIFEPTQFGFRFGSADIERVISDDRMGVVLAIRGRREVVYIRVTPSGLIRLGPVTRNGDPESFQ
jgi:hypothetical protein